MQNKPNLLDAKMNVNIYYTKVYKNETAFRRGKNKPNSNPIKPNLKRAKMNANDFITKDYRKKDDLNERKYLYHKGLQKKRLFSTPKNKPKQSQFLQRPK